MCCYGAITIGPIVDTLSQVSSPGALWCVSGLFSWLSGNLCESILSSGIPDAHIIVPAYEKGKYPKDGIGRWHDRIFFSCSLNEDELGKKLEELCKGAKQRLADNICRAIDYTGEKAEAAGRYIDDYIQLSWLTASEELAHKNGNCVLSLSDYLDSLELTADFAPDESASPITRLLNGTGNSANEYIKKCWLIPETDNARLLKINRSIRTIEDITNPEGCKDGMKKRKYFAVVQSDGDNMGTALKRAPTDEELIEFSKLCVDYTGEAASVINAYGGLTVYAGGDDLLFLAPIEGLNGTNILGLCEKITEIFNEKFSSYCENAPSLSFGISVNYTSFPLYEALNDARQLLFTDAKSNGKNHIALAMRKHSGQTEKLLLPNDKSEKSPLKELDRLIGKNVSEKDDILHSVMYTLFTFRASFLLCQERGLDTKPLYRNQFDSFSHDTAREYINYIKELGDAVAADGHCFASDEEGVLSDKSVDTLCAMLRFAKLYTEKGDN